MSVVSQFILKADDELLLPSSGELKSIKEFWKPVNSGCGLPPR